MNTKNRQRINAWLYVVLMVVCLVNIHLLSRRYFKRLDVTAEHAYTLSPYTQELVKNLPDRVNVTFFVNKDIPTPQIKGVERYLRDMLEEYASLSKKFNYEVIRLEEEDLKTNDNDIDEKPSSSSNKMKLALEFGLTPADPNDPRIHQQKKDSVSLTTVPFYMGIGFTYGDKKEALPLVLGKEGFEYNIYRILVKITGKSVKIGFAMSEEEWGFDLNKIKQGKPPINDMLDSVGFLISLLNQSGYETIPVDLVKEIPKEIDALLVLGPKKPFSERALYVLDQFMMQGKGVGFFLDGQKSPVNKFQEATKKNELGLDAFFKHHGIQLNSDLIFDNRGRKGAGGIGCFLGQGLALAFYSPAFLLSDEIYSPPLVNQGVHRLIFPFASSLEKVSGDGSVFAKIEPLFYSHTKAWRSADAGYQLKKQEVNRPLPPGSDKGPFVFGYQIEGKLKSFFAEKHQVKQDGTTIPAGMDVAGEEPMRKETEQGRWIVVGNSSFVVDYNFPCIEQEPLYQQNLLFMLNAVDYLSKNDPLIELRQKTFSQRPIRELTQQQILMLKIAFIVGVPALLLLLGGARWLIRLRRRKNIHIE